MAWVKQGLRALIGAKAKAEKPKDDVAERLGVTPAPPKPAPAGGASAGKRKAAGKAMPAKTEARKRPPAWRLAVVGFAFFGGMAAAGVRLAEQASRRADAPPAPSVVASATARDAPRARVVDRHGRPLIGSVRTYELYLDLSASSEAERDEAAAALARTFPDLELADLKRRFRGSGTPLVKMSLTPRDAQAAHDLGVPGLYLAERRDRVYYAGPAAAHLLGWTRREPGQPLAGAAGVEAGLESLLADPTRDEIALTIDLRLQLAMRDILARHVGLTGAKGGAAVALSPVTGEVLGLVSYPDFDPHDRAVIAAAEGKGENTPIFNRAVSGRYELGSVMKIATWALALETRSASMIDVYPQPTPFDLNGATIRDDHPMGQLSFPMAFAKSSNIIAAELALKAGRAAQHRFFELAGLHAPAPIRLAEARLAPPRWTTPWNDLATATAAFGHGVSLSPLQMVEMVASVIGGGDRVRATVLRDAALRGPAPEPVRVVREDVSRRMRDLLRLTVTSGTGAAADIPGLEVGGKTGTAEKIGPNGRYDDERVISSFVGAFPMSEPELVVIVMLDEPSVTVAGRVRRTASLTAAPVAREIMLRAAPFVGVALAPGRSG